LPSKIFYSFIICLTEIYYTFNINDINNKSEKTISINKLIEDKKISVFFNVERGDIPSQISSDILITKIYSSKNYSFI